MNTQEKMLAAATGALEHLFKISAKDNVLILTDELSTSIADAFKRASIKNGCRVESYKIKNNERPLKEIPAELEKLLQGKTIVLNIIKSFPEELPFRMKWTFKVEESKLVKMGHMPGITEDMMLNSVNVDFERMKTTADKLIEKLENSNQIHITTDAGTDVLVGIANRKFIDDVGVKPGRTCNIPCGEIYCAPLETEANGVIVFDASINDISLLKQPLKVYLSSGRIIKFESNDKELVKRIIELTNVDDEAWIIGELGIGVNPGARITGNMLEDEKSLGTIHIAFGFNADFGGTNNSKIHRDYLLYRPTVEVRYSDDNRKLLMKQGEFLL